MIIGGLEAPVTSVSPGLITAQFPFELAAGQPYQVFVIANNALTTPQSFEAGAVSPGLSVLPTDMCRRTIRTEARCRRLHRLRRASTSRCIWWGWDRRRYR